MGNVNFHWPHEGWAQVLARRYVQAVGVQLVGTSLPKEPLQCFKSALAISPHTLGHHITFYYYFLPFPKYSPGFSAAAQSRFPGKWLQVSHVAFSFIDPPWVACPGFSSPPTACSKVAAIVMAFSRHWAHLLANPKHPLQERGSYFPFLQKNKEANGSQLLTWGYE